MSGQVILAPAAGSLHGQVYCGIRVRLFSFLLRGISRLTLEMTIVYGRKPAAVTSLHGRIFGYSCTIVFVSIAGDFSAVSHRRRVGRRGTEPVRASILSVYASKSSLPGDCHVAALLAMTVALRVFAWSVIRVRVLSFLLECAQPIKPSPSGEGGLPKHCEGKTDEGKTTIILLLGFYSPHSPLGSLRSAVSHRGRAGWRVFVSDISLPGDCHVAATFRLVA